MPKVKAEFRLTDAEEAPTFASDLDMAIAAELAERQVVTALPDPRLAEGEDETLYPDQKYAIPPLPARQFTDDGPRVTMCEPETREQQMAAAEAKLKALFAAASASGPLPEEDGSSRLRREAIAALIEEGWRHTDAVKCGDRVKELLDGDGDFTYEGALLIARDEFGSAPPVPVPEPVREPVPEPEPTLETLPVKVEPELLVPQRDELAQILHNFERDLARLRKLLGMGGVKRKTKEKHGA